MDEIEEERIKAKFTGVVKEIEQIFTQIPNDIRNGLERNEIELINQEIKRLNKEIIAEREREREQKWQATY